MKTVKLKKFIREYGKEKVFYDPAFQRRVVWKNGNFSKFAVSLIKGRAPHPIVLLDAERCKDHAEEEGDKTSLKYFQEVLSKGYRFVSIDGQNRSKTVEQFLRNEITVTGEFLDEDDKHEPVDNKFFKDLPKRLQDKILSSEVFIVEYTDVLRKDAGELFDGVNSGEPLVSQEKRNSKSTPIAAVVRDIAKNRKKLSLRVLKEEKVNRMEDDELFAKTLMVLMKNYLDPDIKKFDNPEGLGLSDQDINDFYSIGDNVVNINDPSSPYVLFEIDRAKSIIQQVSTIVLNQDYYPPSRLVPQKTYWGIVLLCAYLFDNNYEIYDTKKFMREYVNLDNVLAVDSENAHAKARLTAMKNDKNPDDVTKGEYYFNWTGLPHQSKPRAKRRKALIDGLRSNKVNFKKFGIRKVATLIKDSFSQAA